LLFAAVGEGNARKRGKGKAMGSPKKKGRALSAMVETVGGRFSTELGIRLRSAESGEVFKWFLASVLFGARISEILAIRTYREFEKRGLTSPAKIAACGWDGLVAALDAGGYVRYDFKTATKLQEIVKALIPQYGGDLNRLHRAAADPRDLEAMLKALGKGIGEVTVNIFLRELRGIWRKAQPLPSPLVLNGAKSRKLLPRLLADRGRALAMLEERWAREGNKPGDFADFEAALVRCGLAMRRKASRELAGAG
jgi:hypothetical protein